MHNSNKIQNRKRSLISQKLVSTQKVRQSARQIQQVMVVGLNLRTKIVKHFRSGKEVTVTLG